MPIHLFISIKYKWSWWVSLPVGFAIGWAIAFIFDEDDEYYYSVDNVTASGNQQSYTSFDKQEIDQIVNALNEAIING